MSTSLMSVTFMNPTPATSFDQLSDRGKLILAAAQKMFLAHGFEKTSLAMIIEESGGSRRSVYAEFGNKEGLLMAVVASHVSQQVDSLATINYQLPPQQALQQVCEKFLRGLLSPTLLALFRLVANLVVTMPELGKLIFERGPIAGVTPISDYLQYLDNKGLLAIDDKQFAAHMLMEMVKGGLHLKALLLVELTISNEEISQHCERAIKLFLTAYRP